MSKRNQVLLSLAIVLASVGAAGLSAVLRDDGERQSGATQPHDHSTMAAAASERQPVRLDEDAARRIGVTYATAVVKPLARSVTTVGNVTYDETRLANVNPKIEGWVERLYVDFTGAPIRRGQPLLDVYSPMLVSAQEELILALRLASDVASGGGERAGANARDLVEAARRRLRYWDIPDAVIRRVEQTGEPQRTVVLNAPASGVVVEKMVVQGARIMPGMDLYRIADLSTVWIEGEVFEKDLSLVKLGQRARVTFEAYPGEAFTGTVTYVYPTISMDSRTGRVRIELPNSAQRLKPGMYATLELEADPGRRGLVIPRSAVHSTGERALVFVRGEGGMLTPREITTGLPIGTEIEVLAGLSEGEVVVSSANFLIDAEANMGSSMAGMEHTTTSGTTTSSGSPAGSGHTGH